jgi:hypothetical protein
MQKAARTTALVIVPLAAAVSAHASTVILPTSNFSCFEVDHGGTSGSCSGGALQLGPSDGVAGVQLFTLGAIDFGSSGGNLTLSTNGNTSGGTLLSGTTLPVSWDFVLSPQGAHATSDLIDWQLTLAVWASGSLIGSYATSGSGNDTITGSNSIQTDAPASTDVSLIGKLSWEGDINASGIDVSVPEGTSFDFNSPGATAVPEPATTGLLATGLACIACRVRKVRRR